MKIIRILIVFIIIIAGYYLFIWAIHPNAAPDWTGFGKYNEDKEGPRAKTLWDWLELLIIPLAIGTIAWIFKEA